LFMCRRLGNNVACIIGRDHPVISRISCVTDVLLWGP